MVNIKTHHTLSIDAGIVGLTDVAGLGATTWSITIALVSRRTGAYREAGTWWRQKVITFESLSKPP